MTNQQLANSNWHLARGDLCEIYAAVKGLQKNEEGEAAVVLCKAAVLFC